MGKKSTPEFPNSSAVLTYLYVFGCMVFVESSTGRQYAKLNRMTRDKSKKASHNNNKAKHPEYQGTLWYSTPWSIMFPH